MMDHTYVCCRCGTTEQGVTKVQPDDWPDAFHCPDHPLGEKASACSAPTEVLTFGDEAWMVCGCGEYLALHISVDEDRGRYVKGADHSAAWQAHIEADESSLPSEECPNDHGPDGRIECWSPGGPCPEGQAVCESCGPCNHCRPGQHPSSLSSGMPSPKADA